MYDEFAQNADNEAAYEPDEQLRHHNRRDPTNMRRPPVTAPATFIEKAQPNPGGARIFALSTYGTPPFNPIGSSYMVQRMPHPEEPAPQYINHTAVPTQLGGLIAGSNLSQPLYDGATDTIGGFDVGED